MSDAPSSNPSLPAAPALLRLAVAGTLFTVVPGLVFLAARSLGYTTEGGALDEAYGFGSLAVGALALVVLALSWSPGRPLLPLRPFAVTRLYATFALPWIGLLVGYLAARHFLGNPVEPQPPLLRLAQEGLARPGSLVVVLTIALAVPIAEELVFRGYLQQALEAMFGSRVAWVSTAAVFGLAHGIDYAPPLALVGLFLGYLRNRCGSLGAPMLAHALHNGLTATVAILWPETLDWMYFR